MAIIDKNLLLTGVHGKIGGQFVVKQYKDKMVLSVVPDMSNVKPSMLQKQGRKNFAAAVEYAQGINRDPVKKKAYAKKVKDGQSVYHYAIKEFFRKGG